MIYNHISECRKNNDYPINNHNNNNNEKTINLMSFLLSSKTLKSYVIKTKHKNMRPFKSFKTNQSW